MENKMVKGSGRMETQGIGNNRPVKECVVAAWTYFENNAKHIIPGIRIGDKDYLLYLSLIHISLVYPYVLSFKPVCCRKA